MTTAYGYEDITKQLIEVHYDIDLQTKSGDTPLIITTHRGHASVTKQLIEARCNIEFQNKDGGNLIFVRFSLLNVFFLLFRFSNLFSEYFVHIY